MADSKLPFFLFGLGVGAAAGLLFAPKSGEEMREDVRQRASEGREYLKRRSDELREQAEHAFEQGRENVQSRREHLSAALEAGRRAYRDAATEDPAATSAGS